MVSAIVCQRRAQSTLILASYCFRNIRGCSLQASPSRRQSWRNLESCQIQSMYAVFTSKTNQDLKPILKLRDLMLVAVTKISSQTAYSNIHRILELKHSPRRRGMGKGTTALLSSCHTVATRVLTSTRISRIWRSTLWMTPTELHLLTKPALRQVLLWEQNVQELVREQSNLAPWERYQETLTLKIRECSAWETRFDITNKDEQK